MKVSVPYVQDKFREFNQLMFAGKLPELPIELSDAKGFLGACRYKKSEKEDGSVELYDFRLSINTRIDLPEAVIEDTIIHEMIHYFIGLNRLEDSSSHGPMFQHLMNTINEKYGRHITIKHRGTEKEEIQAIDKRAKWHIIAVVTFYGGRKGIKVLPRILEKILAYNKGVSTGPGVEHVDFFMSNNPFFNRFPNSAALYVDNIPKEDIETHLQGAKKVIVTDDRVIVPR